MPKNAASHDARAFFSSGYVVPAIWLSAAVLVLLAWTHIFNLVSESRALVIANAERDLANLTRVSQEHANRTFRSADQVIRFVQAAYLQKGERLDLTALTAQGVIDTEIFNQVGVIDSHGIYALANRPLAGRLDLSDREHFKIHVPADTGELFVSKPVIGRSTGKWSIQLTRRITRPNGEFAGVVVVSVDPGYFTRFYADLNLGPQGMAALYGLDGIARARRVGLSEDFGVDARAGLLFSRIARNELVGSYLNLSVVDGVERIYHYRKIPGYQLAVIAGVDMQSILSAHGQSERALYRQLLLVSMLIVALALALTRHLWQIRRDSAARASAAELLQDRTEQLNAIFEMSPDGFVSFDRERRVRYVSPAFVAMMARDAEHLQGLDERDFSAWLSNLCNPAASFSGVEQLRLATTATGHGGRELIEVDHFGKHVFQVGLRSNDTSSVSQILYFRDVTRESEVDRMKDEFLSTAAHELRTPMASIFGFTEILITHDNDAATQKEYFEIIYRQSQRMVEILDELLDLARIEARRGKDFKYSRVCGQELLAEIIRDFKLPEGRTPPQLSAPADAIYVMADAGKLRQAVLNVLVNAYKFSPMGGQVVVQMTLNVQDPKAPMVCIHIADQGMGMSAAHLAQLGTRFFRADTTGTVPGSGLGMSIVKEIVSLHKGFLVVDSTLGRGTKVSISLPVGSST